MSSVEIFLVDDDEDFIASSKKWVLDDDVKLKTFTSPADALNSLANETPDIVITDVIMPQINGINLSKLCLSILEHKNVIIISANTKEQIKKDLGLEVGDYFQKPLDASFMNEVDKIIDKVRFDKKDSNYIPTHIDPVEARLKVSLIQSYLKDDYSQYQQEMYHNISHMNGSSYCNQIERLKKHKMDIEKYHNQLVDFLDIQPWEKRLEEHINPDDNFQKKVKNPKKNPKYPNGYFICSVLKLPKKDAIEITDLEIKKDSNNISFLFLNGAHKINVLVDQWIDHLHMDNNKEIILSRFLCESIYKYFK